MPGMSSPKYRSSIYPKMLPIGIHNLKAYNLEYDDDDDDDTLLLYAQQQAFERSQHCSIPTSSNNKSFNTTTSLKFDHPVHNSPQ
eukprot:scaffold9523_cov103-Cylindrotheca_fusiformis.AAC.19